MSVIPFFILPRVCVSQILGNSLVTRASNFCLAFNTPPPFSSSLLIISFAACFTLSYVASWSGFRDKGGFTASILEAISLSAHLRDISHILDFKSFDSLVSAAFAVSILAVTSFGLVIPMSFAVCMRDISEGFGA